MSRVLQTGSNRITQTYAQHVGWSKGVDIVKKPSYVDNIVAHTNGKVIKVMRGQKNGSKDSEGFGYGNYIIIAHSNNYATLYAHLNSVTVEVGQTVSKGQLIGRMGNTGHSFGAHLHFEVRKYTSDPSKISNLHDTSKFEWLDPTPYINADLPGNVSGEYKIGSINYSVVFDPEYYLNNYADLKAAFGNDYNKAWNHFKQFGMKEARQAHKNFNVTVYKSNYKDLRDAFGNNMPAYYQHYCVYGRYEGRITI